MKFIKNILLVAAMSLPFFTSCNTEEKPLDVDNSQIELSEESVVAGPQGAEITVTVKSSEDWRIAGFSEWITFASETGKPGSDLKLTVAPNDGIDVKTAEIKVFAGSAEKTLTVTSNPDMYLELAKEGDIDINSEAGSFTVGVKTNCPEIEIAYADGSDAWLENTGAINGFSGKTMYEFKATRTDKYKTRTGKITFKMKDSDKAVSVNVNQAQLDTVIVVSGPKIVHGLSAVDFDLVLQSNIDFSYSFPDWIVEKEKIVADKDEETGLTTTTFKLHCDKTVGTRAKTIEFTTRQGYYTVTLGKVLIKQQNPNPVYCTIPDPQLREILIAREWVVLEDEATGKCEVISKGMTESRLIIEGNDYNPFQFQTLAGLESFPKLSYLEIFAASIKNIDLSKVTTLKSAKFINCPKIETCDLGDVALDRLTVTLNEYGNQEFKNPVLKGSKVKEVNFDASSFYIAYYGDVESVDVTAMPSLETLSAMRIIPSYWGESRPSTDFKTIYMTEAQKSTVKVTKCDHVQIVVK